MSLFCSHAGWFRLSGQEQTYLHYANRTNHVIQEMARPDTQYPSMILLIGRKAKDAALRQLFPNNNIRRGRTDSIIDLRSDSTTVSSDFPILFADSDPWTSKACRIGDFPCHQNHTSLLDWETPKGQNINHTLMARLVALFSDVICLFADDFGSLRDVARFLVDWIRLGSPSTSPQRIRPRVVVVSNEASPSVTYNLLATEDFHLILQQEDVNARAAVFSSISLLRISGDQISMLARHRRLKEVLFSELDLSRKDRIEQRMLFSAVHFSAFVEHATRHVSQSLTSPFDHIATTRLNNPLGPDYQRHLYTVLVLARQHHLPYGTLATFIASTIILDAYPPRMHKFAPLDLFNGLYKASCSFALDQAFESTDLTESICQEISNQLELLFLSVDVGFETSIQLHANTLRSHSAALANLKSQHTCLFCIRRKPEYVLTCKHAICDVCLVRFGQRLTGKECHYEITKCILCVRKGTAVAKVKPSTADARILSIDGGGVAGVVPLEYLGLLQRALAPDLQIQDLFEEAFGTSSGGLVVIGMFLKCWDVATCIRTFDLLVRDFFGLHLTKGQGVVTRVRNYFRCWLSDGCYDVDALEKSLKDVFGQDRRMFDTPDSGVSGCKVAVTATTISDAFTYVFSNYNGNGVRDRACGYKHFRPEQAQDEPFLWEAGRATSAAPVLFKPARIKSLGSFQDGGLKHNNPMDLAVWESQKIWSVSTTADVVLSLGTGTRCDLQSPQASHFRHVFNDGFIPRLYRSLMSSLDGEQTWRDSVNSLDEARRANYFRLNIHHPGDEPRLDDVGQIDGLRECVHLQPTDTKDLTGILCALLASSFYLQLSRMPLYRSGQFLCHGVLRCRNHSRAVLESLNQLHMTQMDIITPTESLGRLSSHNICSSCREYRQVVQFHVRSLEEVLSICIRFNGNERRHISGMPHSMMWFIDQQQIASPFGTIFHDLLTNQCGTCGIQEGLEERTGKRKAGVSPTEQPTASRKRPRLRIEMPSLG